MKKILMICVFAFVAIYAFAAAPVVSNVSATPAAGQVTITYDLTADGACTVSLLVSSDNGSRYMDTPLTAVSGAIGNSVSAGTGNQIIWHPAGDGMAIGASYKVKVIARDNPNPTAADDFILVEGGTFSNGTSNVTISSFYIDKYEITQAEYQAVMGTNPSSFSGNPNRPVERVSWFNAIEYSNRRSMQEGLSPCYSYGTFGTNPDNWPSGWNTLDANHTNVSCNWTANGYRLPTEMEWMFAAKGGNQSQGYTYSGSNTIGDVAWSNLNSSSRTWDVGSLASNELGTFDMSGNVWEWCWDIYGSTYPSGSQNNPTGASSGSSPVKRGGSWNNGAHLCTVSNRSANLATYSYSILGFRCVRIAP
jgi:formylglycine-generating enzyme